MKIKTLEEIERDHITATLDHFNGDKTKAANALGITVKTIYNKINKWKKIRN